MVGALPEKVRAALRDSTLAQKVYRRLVVPLSRQSEPDLYLVRGCTFDTAVDVGANVGTYSIELAKVSRHVVAFEPVRVAYHVLKHVVPYNVKCYEFALGESNESGTISIPNHEGRLESALASISPSDQPGGAVQDVEIRSFDAGWSQFRPQADACIDFVKIDVEGYELSSLKGMMKTVEKFLPVLLIEIEIRHNRSFSEVFVLLDSLGYRSYYSPDGISLVPCCSQDLQQLQTKERLDSNRQQQPKGYSRGEKRRYINNFWFVHTRSRAASHLDSLTRAREKC